LWERFEDFTALASRESELRSSFHYLAGNNLKVGVSCSLTTNASILVQNTAHRRVSIARERLDPDSSEHAYCVQPDLSWLDGEIESNLATSCRLSMSALSMPHSQTLCSVGLPNPMKRFFVFC
jgi:hypothetical protein